MTLKDFMPALEVSGLDLIETEKRNKKTAIIFSRPPVADKVTGSLHLSATITLVLS